MEKPAEIAFDTVTGLGAVSSPWWLLLFNGALHEAILIGGAVLLGLRLAVAWRQFRRKRTEPWA